MPPLAFVEIEHWWLPVPEDSYEVLAFESHPKGAADIVLRSRDIAIWVQSRGFGGIPMEDGEKLIDIYHDAFNTRYRDFTCDSGKPAETVREGRALGLKLLAIAGGAPGWKHRAFSGVGVLGSILTWSEPPQEGHPDPGLYRVEHLLQIDDKNWSILFVPIRHDAIELARSLPAYVRTARSDSEYPVPGWMPLVFGLTRGDPDAVRALVDRRDVPWARGFEKILERLVPDQDGK
jgi:hypothetical protein